MAKDYSGATSELFTYAKGTFRPEDAVLKEIRARAQSEGLPDIHVGAMDGLHLEVLAHVAQARRIVEVGTLAGYSGVCLARGLQPDGRLFTFEFDPKHAKVAEESFRRAGLGEKVKVIVGPAIDNLPKIVSEGPFDLVFIDADKASYPFYYSWAVENIRPGGVILADNTFAGGEICEMDKSSPRLQALRDYNQKAATDPRLRTTLLPTSDGLTFSVRI